MKKYTIYHSTDGVIAKGRAYPTTEGLEIPDLDPELTFLVEVTEAKPPYDSATQKLKRLAPSYDLENKVAIVTDYEVVDLTQEEIDAKIPAHVEIGGIKYDTSEQSQNALTRMATLVAQAGMADTDEVAVKDVLGVSHPLTVAEFNADMIQFGMFCYSQFHAVPEVDDSDLI